jgi:thiol:disulfide interchange protein DsbD
MRRFGVSHWTVSARLSACPITLLVAAAAVVTALAVGEPPPSSEPGASPLPVSGTGPAEAATGAHERIITGTIVGRANQQKVVEARVVAPLAPVRPGQAVALSVQLEMKPGWHVNSARPTLAYLIATHLEFPDTGSFVVEDVWYPDGHMVALAFAEERLSVYEGLTTIRPTLRSPRAASAGDVPVRARITYQACSDRACLAPEKVEFSIPFRIAGDPVDPGAAVVPQGGDDRRNGGAAPAAAGGGERVDLLTALSEQGLPFVLGLVFLWGLGLNLTPCVYPMIPVTIGFFGNQAAGGWARRIALPAVYVLGMALTYSTLGVVAGLSGGLFGATLQSPWMIAFLVTLFVAMALWMFGMYELRLPGALTRFGGGRVGTVGALLMGLTMGIVAAPCIGPFIVVLLAFVSASGDPVLGFLLFFVMAIGLGVPFLVLGTFSGALTALPRSGVWMIYAKKVMGIAMLAVALYFLQPFLTDRQIGLAALTFALASGLYLGWLERSRMASPWFPAVRVAVAVAIVALGAWLSLPLLAGRPEAKWQDYSGAGLQAARDGDRPIIIDFFAEWCLPCKELDRNTFSNGEVIRRLERFELFKADLTSFESEPVRDLRDRFDIIGVPTIVFIDSSGTELTELRLYGFEPATVFLERLSRVD